MNQGENFRKKNKSIIIFDPFSIMPVISHDPHSTLALYSIYITLYNLKKMIKITDYAKEKNHNHKIKHMKHKQFDGMC